MAAEVAGPLDENYYVVDFILLRDVLRGILDELDHYMLLPTQHEQIRVVAGEREVEATFRDRRWVFPRGDCVLLPVPNTTAEMLARWIGQRLLERLAARGVQRPGSTRIEVDECFGQLGIWQTDDSSTGQGMNSL